MNKLAGASNTRYVDFDVPFDKIYNRNSRPIVSKPMSKNERYCQFSWLQTNKKWCSSLINIPLEFMPNVLELLQQDVEEIEIAQREEWLNREP